MQEVRPLQFEDVRERCPWCFVPDQEDEFHCEGRYNNWQGFMLCREENCAPFFWAKAVLG